jgi:hypothetical protein
MKVTDKIDYVTTHWTVETEDDCYRVQRYDGDMEELWIIESDEEGPIDYESEFGQQLIELCEKYERSNTN